MSPLDRDRLERLLAAFDRQRVLVVGDVMLDEYLWGEVERISPEAPVPVVHVQRESLALGGAANVARNVVALGASCALCGVVGDDDAARQLESLTKELAIESSGLVRLPGRPTSRKTRVVARSQQLVRFDRENDDPLPPGAADRLLAAIDEALAGTAGAILEDYDKGALSPQVLDPAMARFAAAGVPVHVDPKRELGCFRGADLIKPNLRELEQLSGTRIRTPDQLAPAAQRVREAIGGGDVVVTRGREGMTLFGRDANAIDVHTAAREVFDVQGAGDTTIATLALARLAGATLLEAAVLANAAAGVVLGEVGTATASREEVTALLDAAIAAAEGTP